MALGVLVSCLCGSGKRGRTCGRKLSVWENAVRSKCEDVEPCEPRCVSGMCYQSVPLGAVSGTLRNK